MLKITLCCAGGWSTSLLLKKMKKAALAGKIETEIQAVPESNFNEYVVHTDVLILAPQIGHMKEEMVKKYPDLKIMVVDYQDYALMNGENVLNEAIALLKK